MSARKANFQTKSEQKTTTVVPNRRKRSDVRRGESSGHSPALRPTMLLVLGMHRSGTSVTARLLECLGAVNSSRLMPPAPENNEKGFFEDWDIFNFNESKLLPRLRLTWHSLGFVDWSHLPTPTRSKFALEALEIVRRNYSPANPLSILKEPRIGVLLPFWLSVLKHAGYNIQVVCAIRDPASVARSLAKRDGFSLTQAGMLFATYWLSILTHIQDLPVAFVQFDEIFSNPSRVARQVALQCRLPLPANFDSLIHGFSSSFFDASLRHSSLEKRDLPLETDLPPLAISIYESLLAAAQSQNVKKTAKLLSYAENLLAEVKPVFTDFDRAIHEINQERGRRTALEAECARLVAVTDQAKSTASQASLLSDREASARGQLAERVSALETERSTLDARLSTLSSEHSSLVISHSSLVAERDTLTAEKQALDGRLSTAASERDALASERGQLSERVSALDAERQRLAQDLEAARQRLAEAETLATSQAAERSTLDARLSTLDSEHSSLATSYSSLVAERDTLEAERNALEARLSTLDAEHSSLATSYSSLVAERDALASQKITLEEQNKDLASESSLLKKSVEDRFKELAKAAREIIDLQDGLELGKREARQLEEQFARDRGRLSERVSSLESERTALGTRLTILDSEHSALATRYSLLVAERDELATHHATLVTEREALARERGQLAERVSSLETEKQALASEHSDLATRHQQLATECDTLTASLAERFEEIARLGRRILEIEAASDARAAALQAKMDAMAARWTWKLGAPLRFTWDKTWNTGVKIIRLPTALHILLRHRGSGFFNHEWYYAQNPDVKASTARPFLHFAFHGVYEGRAPNPDYNEQAYLRQTPAVASSRRPALLHYTLKG